VHNQVKDKKKEYVQDKQEVNKVRQLKR